MYIRIIQGTYGHVVQGSKIVEPKDVQSGPFELSDDEAQRLINLGVASEAGKPEREGKTGRVLNKVGEEKGKAGTAFTLSALERVPKAVQEKLAEMRKVDLSAATNAKGRAKLLWDDIQATKTGYVPQSIEEVLALTDDDTGDEDTDDDTTNDGEAPPDLTVGEPVTT